MKDLTGKLLETYLKWAVFRIEPGSVVSRSSISDSTGLGAGTVRTLFNKLRETGHIESTNRGTVLTEKGERTHDRLAKLVTIKTVKAGKLGFGKHGVAILVKGASDKVTNGMEQRDAAISAGAMGVTTLVFRKGRLIMPGFGGAVELRDLAPQDEKELLANLAMGDGDVVIVGSEKSAQDAERSAWVAASTLI